jgi:hypothetical protein
MPNLGQKQLAYRWLISPRTLEQWRWQGKGPKYLKIGSKVVYRLEDVEAFESEHLQLNTTGSVGVRLIVSTGAISGDEAANAFEGCNVGCDREAPRPAPQDNGVCGKRRR